ncbi:MAG: secondary thiamine-phosphate synthase enzyme YjbQ [Thermodesulfobacteriota bacterium]
MQKAVVTVSTANFMELIDITGSVEAELDKSGMTEGLCLLFNPHTTAGLTINEGADPAVRRDIVSALKRMIPFDLSYQHQEGNSPSHVLASLFGASLTVFVENGRLRLGTWQRIFFCEFDGPRSRKVYVRFLAG